ncbi:MULTISPECIES: hypothetical protein [Metallosphaera]|nr:MULTISPECIES: hypothetical protein [Metallosphaera]MCY0861297.1 hypothetical protein [Metallosphaera prunae]WPX07225.1 hypothetical protein SOJ17_000984 [Metallosphaera sedula DSM 5348]BBL47060.1 hypothetical protein MJ1HA_1161 [Metallosphaera sedula]
MTQAGLLQLEEIYGKDAVEQLRIKSVEELVKVSLRVHREDPGS